MTIIKKYLIWLRNIIIWILERRILLLCLLVLGFVFCLLCFVWKSELAIRIAGFSLQVLGLGVALRNLLNLKKMFKLKSYFETLKDWLPRFPKMKPVSMVVDGVVPAATATAKGTRESWMPDNPDQSIGDRIKKIFINLDYLKQSQKKTTEKINQNQRKLEQDIKREGEKTRTALQENQATTKKLFVDDIPLNLCGLVWLFIGLVMGTFSAEIETCIPKILG